MNISRLRMVLLVIGILAFGAAPSLAQDQMLQWYFPGKNLNFMVSPPTPGIPYPPGNVPGTWEISNGICDENGKTLFYIVDEDILTVIYNSSGTPLEYLIGNTSKEIAIVPMPGDCTRFYVIYIVYGDVYEPPRFFRRVV